MRDRWAVFSIALSLLTAVAGRAGAQSPADLERVLGELHDIRAARDLGAAGGKVSTRLRDPLSSGPLSGGLVAAPPPTRADGRRHVYLDCSPLGPTQLATLAQVGVAIERADMASGRVQAWVEGDSLDALAAFSWVRAVRAIDPAVVRSGSVTTEGDRAARSDVLRGGGPAGAGVVVGVISDGIDHLADAQATNDLPADVAVPSDPRCRRGSGDEGTALLEIVHDVAPGARLLFSGPSSSVEMADAVACLVDAGANVIVDDLGFFGEPYFEDGPVAQAVAAAVAAGVSYHSSAGNEAESHVEQNFIPVGGGNGAHDFAQGGKDAFDEMIVPAGATLTCILEWNDPFGASSNDYDLALLDKDLNVVAFSTDPQSGVQDPIEIVSVVNATNENQTASIVIPRFSGQPRRLEVFCLGAFGLEHVTPEGSIVGHPALASVVAVGAVDALDPGLDDVEPFSSRGPSRIDFPTPETRAKPDLVAFDGVAISNAGGFPACPPSCAFFGTSAASPHTAGVAALLLSANPSLSPAEIQAALTNGAVDIGPSGFDDASGFGRLDAVAASDAIAQNPPDDPPDDPGNPPGDDPPCVRDDECADDDPCTTDVCDPERGCVSTAPAGADGLSCLLDRIAEPDACDPDELDAKTLAFVAKRLDAAAALLTKAERATRPAARATALRKLARKLQAIRKRFDRLNPEVVSDDCVESLAALVDQAQSLTSALRP